MSHSPNPKTGMTIVLYIFGIALLITAAMILLKGLGILTAVPGYVIWALVLVTIGLGIIGGLQSTRQ